MGRGHQPVLADDGGPADESAVRFSLQEHCGPRVTERVGSAWEQLFRLFLFKLVKSRHNKSTIRREAPLITFATLHVTVVLSILINTFSNW